MKKTAVEWYEKEINSLLEKYESKEISTLDFIIIKHNLFDRAKEMEKQQQDESAIEFSKWCLDIGIYNQFKKTQGINKELLEIYKKEKGL